MWRCCKGEIALPETRWRLGWGTGNLERDEEGLGERFWGVRETRERRAGQKYQTSRGFGREIRTPLISSTPTHFHGYHEWVFFFFLTLASVSLKPIQLILTLSIWKWHQTPHPSNETVPLPHFSCWSQVQVVTLFLAEWVEIRGTDNALLRSVNFLEWLTELRETFYFLDPQLIRKGCNSGTAR